MGHTFLSVKFRIYYKSRIGIIPIEAWRVRNKSFILIRVDNRKTQHGQMGTKQPPFIRASTWLVIVNRIEKLITTGDPLMPRCKGGIGQKNDFEIFGSHIM